MKRERKSGNIVPLMVPPLQTYQPDGSVAEPPEYATIALTGKLE